MTDWQGRHEAERGLLRMSGGDARRILQDVVTNDVGPVSEQNAVYAALLTPQGKYLFDFFLIGDGDDIIIDTAADRRDALAQRLKMYCLRRDAQIAPEETLQVSTIWPATDADIEGMAPPAPDAIRWVPDPRDTRLGFRGYGARYDGPEAEPGARDALRVRLAVPEGGVELIPEATFILEAGFDRLNGVDFRKGCYVGQEVTARMKHKTELRKGLARVSVEGAAPIGTQIMADGKPAGTLFTQSNGQGLAHLRFDRVRNPMEAEGAKVSYET